MDDSCRVGYAIVSPEINFAIKKRINNYFTVFDAEALAIEEAVNYILDNKTAKSFIFSDFFNVLSNLRAPDCWHTTHGSILRIKNILYQCNKLGLLAKLMWIPSHCILGNELADFLAK